MSIFVADALAKTLLVDIVDVYLLMTAFKRIKIAAPYSQPDATRTEILWVNGLAKRKKKKGKLVLPKHNL